MLCRHPLLYHSKSYCLGTTVFVQSLSDYAFWIMKQQQCKPDDQPQCRYGKAQEERKTFPTGNGTGRIVMTLLTAVFAAVSSTVLWYFKDSKNQIKLGTLSLMYWGAALMWTADAVLRITRRILKRGVRYQKVSPVRQVLLAAVSFSPAQRL